LPEVSPPKGGKVVVGDKFEPRFFEGVYKLHETAGAPVSCTSRSTRRGT